ncbi:hypothetical protein L3Y34_011680 [Caenorhabditis briggsae]|uniref:Uncharacterized protein n=1 Tax=Caenorhabditis briggsae TaxID=6238 RepID=A0AAE8ZPG3_CAEBR|nr:hypothetical protein L3Y34_011680 [Caenorhabditis briggsae]
MNLIVFFCTARWTLERWFLQTGDRDNSRSCSNYTGLLILRTWCETTSLDASNLGIINFGREGKHMMEELQDAFQTSISAITTLFTDGPREMQVLSKVGISPFLLMQTSAIICQQTNPLTKEGTVTNERKSTDTPYFDDPPIKKEKQLEKEISPPMDRRVLKDRLAELLEKHTHELLDIQIASNNIGIYS